MLDYFMELINDAINNDTFMPGEYTVWSDDEGWTVIDRETGNELEIIIREV